MSALDREVRIRELVEALPGLTDGQLGWIELIVSQLKQPCTIERLEDSALISPCFVQDFGDALRVHHCFSKEPFTKDKFEYAMERVTNLCGLTAKLAKKENPGHDITIERVKYSLKTQADKKMQVNKIHISKFMELGKGEWSDNPDDLIGLRQQFFDHMALYDKILTLRNVERPSEETAGASRQDTSSTKSGKIHSSKKAAQPKLNDWKYELIEIPKSLLVQAETGTLRMIVRSKQNPKPGYCDVEDDEGNIKFQLYFDGGSERKLQIKAINKIYCKVLATWKFADAK